MPLTHLVCYCDSCDGNRELPVEDALRHAEERQGGRYSYELLSAMLATVQDRGDRISTTLLSAKCLRSEVLQRTEDYTGDPERMYPSFRGTMFHGQLEQHAHPGSIAEPRFHKQVVLPSGEVQWFSGSPDLIDVRKGTLYDYKFNKENPRWDKPWKEHVIQGQVNRWLCDHAEYVELRDNQFFKLAAGFDFATVSDRLPLDAELYGDWELNRERFVPVDWQGIYVVYMDDRGPKSLLCTTSIQIPKKDGTGTKAARVADIWSDEEVESFVLSNYARTRATFDAMEAGEVPDIPEGYENWQHPLCAWCPVKASCINHFIEEARQQPSERTDLTVVPFAA